MNTIEKLGILADAAKYDVACTSSGIDRAARAGELGSAHMAGCCHAFTADGRCITLLKVLLSNACAFDCAYCVNRRGTDSPRCTFEPRELADGVCDAAHGGKDACRGLLRAEMPERLAIRQLDVDAHTVGKASQPVDELRRGAGDGLDMDIAAKAMLLP